MILPSFPNNTPNNKVQYSSVMPLFFKVMMMLFLGTLICNGQEKYEREFRIKKSQFPELKSDSILADGNIKRKRYYKEVDSLGATYILKFKKNRLYYHLTFNDSGELLNSGFRINEIDFPDETIHEIKRYLSGTFEKFKIRRMYQQYAFDKKVGEKSQLKNTFQNLLLPDNLYRLNVKGKKGKTRTDYDFWFNAEGHLIKKRTALPMNHDRILY